MLSEKLKKRLFLLAVASGAINIVALVPFALGLLMLASIPTILREGIERFLAGPNRWYVLYMLLSLFYCAIIGVSLLQPDLYRRELKYIFPFLAFVMMSTLRLTEKSIVGVLRLLVFLCVFSLAFLIASLPLMGSDLSWIYTESDNMWEEYIGSTHTYLGQFVSHSAAGGFFATVFLLLFGVHSERSARKYAKRLLPAMMAILLLLLFLTRSRAFGLGVVVVIFVATTFRIRTNWVRRSVATLVFLSTIPAAGWIAWRDIQQADLLTLLGWRETVPEYNVYTRFFLWERAISDFSHSPLVGVGISRFDDEARVLWTMPVTGPRQYLDAPIEPHYFVAPFIRVNVDAFQAHTDQHAHNNYLQVLAEGGIVFFTLFVMAYATTLRALGDVVKASTGDIRGLARGVRYAIWGVAVASFFGNNLFSVIPMFLLLSIAGALCGRRRIEDRWMKASCLKKAPTMHAALRSAASG